MLNAKPLPFIQAQTSTMATTKQAVEDHLDVIAVFPPINKGTLQLFSVVKLTPQRGGGVGVEPMEYHIKEDFLKEYNLGELVTVMEELIMNAEQSQPDDLREGADVREAQSGRLGMKTANVDLSLSLKT